jgi:hypothetical protein
MQHRIRTAAVSVALALSCSPSVAAAALAFSPAPHSPYATTRPAFVANSGGILGGAAAGDFNGDGISDVAVVDGTGVPVFSPGESVSVLLGSRSDGLTLAPGPPAAIYTGGYMSASGPIATGDFNGDGKTDVAVVDSVHNTVAILLGNGHGELHLSGTPTSFSGGGSASSIATGDFNGDGKLDVAVVNGSLNVLLGDGSGELRQAPGSPLTLPAFSTAVVAGHLNADGREDLAVADMSGRVSVYLSNAAGEMTATAQSPLIDSGGLGYIASADFNRDGNADLAVVSPASEEVTVLLGDGMGNFTEDEGSPFPVPGARSSSEPGLPDSIAVGNFVCNDVPDIAVANFNGSSDSVAVLQGDGSGSFTNPIGSPFPANGNPRPLVVGDFNGDGKPDIAAVNSFQGTVTALENTSRPEPCPPPPCPHPHMPPPTPPASPGGSVLSCQSTGNPVGGPPSIQALVLRRHTIRAGRSLSLGITLSGSATIVVEFERAMVRHGHAHGRRPLRPIGSVTLTGHQGTNTFTIKRLNGHGLAAGRYTLVVFTRMGARTSAVRTITLTVRR